MTKKASIACVMLFLFAFTFSFAFTLANVARAEGGECCIYEWCDPEHTEIGAMGHEVFDKGEGWFCVFDGTDDCDIAYICSNP